MPLRLLQFRRILDDMTTPNTGTLFLAVVLALFGPTAQSGPAPLGVTAEVRGLPSGLTCPKAQTRFNEYGKEVRDAFWKIYRDGGTTIYCAAPFRAQPRRTTPSGLPVNIEHAVPQASMKGIQSASGDPHNLWPSILEVNAARAHWRLVDNIPGEVGFFAGRAEPELAGCDFELQPTDDSAVVEPAVPARGPLARAILHMVLAYPEIRIRTADVEQLQSWHAAYAVSAEERRRNDEIEALTGVRNAFVDFPEWGRRIVEACRRQESF